MRKKLSERAKLNILTIIGVIIGFLLLIAICAAVGIAHERKSGKSTPEEIVTAYVQTLETQSKKQLSYIINSHDPNRDTLTEQLLAHAKKLPTINSINYDGIEMVRAELDISETIHEAIPNITIQDAALYYASIPMTQSLDGGTYETLTGYYVGTYKTYDKWYLYDASRDIVEVTSGVNADGTTADVAQTTLRFNSAFLGGNREIGYIPLDDTWMEYSIDDTGFMEDTAEIVSAVHYTQETDNAAIHMFRLRTDKSIEELAEQLLANLQKNDPNAAANEAGEIAGQPAICTRYADVNTGIYFTSYLLKAPDGDVRYLVLEATEDYILAYIYLLDFVLPGT